jgi:hypothetical protein
MRIAAIAGAPRPFRLAAITAATFLALTACSASPRSSADSTTASGSAAPVTSTTAAAGIPASSVPGEPALVVYKTPTCGCCKGWVKAMESAGFKVEVHDLDDLSATKHAAGVPDELQACHTARIGGYVVEGHVPAEDIRRLLAERPDVAGIAAPGMPMGSPGMEGAYKDHYDVVTFGGNGRSAVFASH